MNDLTNFSVTTKNWSICSIRRVTRWLVNFFNIWRQILNEPLKIAKDCNFFCQSAEMSPNLITLPIASDDATIAIHHEIRISGHPGRPVFNSQVLSKSQTTYKISWTTESFAPIEEYRLLYRKLPVSECQHIIMALPLYQPTNLPTYH